MARHRGVYDPNNPEPYELSRSRIEAFINCPACFWLDRVKGVKFHWDARILAKYCNRYFA